jgi:hypothetical protein
MLASRSQGGLKRQAEFRIFQHAIVPVEDSLDGFSEGNQVFPGAVHRFSIVNSPFSVLNCSALAVLRLAQVIAKKLAQGLAY